VQPDDLDGLGGLTDETVAWMDQRLAEFEGGMSRGLQNVLSERLYVAPEDGLTLGGAVFRLAVFHELKKTGVLTYDEFRRIKAGLLGL
jgi:hypothetical protein